MSNYSSLKATINANIKQNGTQAITGTILNSVLTAMVDSIGAGYQYQGVATPSSPGSSQTPDYKCFYIATKPGTYTYLGGIVVNKGEVAILKYDTAWSKDVTGASPKGDFSYEDISQGASAFELQGFFALTDTTESNFRTNSSFLSHVFLGLAPGDKIGFNVRVNSNCNRFTAIDASGNIIDTNVSTNGNVFQEGEYVVPANAVKVYLTIRNDSSFVADQTYWLTGDLREDLSKCVSIKPQTFTTSQKTQARNNIDAVGKDDELKAAITLSGNDFYINGYLVKTATTFSELATSSSSWKYIKIPATGGDIVKYTLYCGGGNMMCASVAKNGTILHHIVGQGANTEASGTYTAVAGTAFVFVCTYADYLSASSVTYYQSISGIIDRIDGKSVVSRNDPILMDNLFKQALRPLSRDTTKQIVLMQFSDIHANRDALLNVVDFGFAYADYINDIIHCGDSVETYWTSASSFAFWGSAGADKILNVIGNHDSATYNGSYDWDGVSEADCRARFFDAYLSLWGVTCPTGKCYYYKDYANGNLRIIVLDEMHYGQDQHDWFEARLAEAITNSYAVIVAIHSSVNPIHTKLTTFASAELTSLGIGNLTPNPSAAVASFMGDGGKFVCWLNGHTHFDDCGFLEDYPNQLHIVITSQNNRQCEGGDTDRTSGMKQEDAFNIVSVDTNTGLVRVFRIGADYDRLLRHKGTFCYNYETHTLISNN